MAGGALSYGDDLLVINHLALRTMTGVAVVDSRHEDIGGESAAGGMMTVIALHHRVPGVIESCLRHPAVDKERSGDRWRRVSYRLHLVAKDAAIKRGADTRFHPGLQFVGVGDKEDLAFEILPGANALAQL